MIQQEIEYCEIMALGFKVEETSDSVFFNQYGYEYKIFTFSLTNLVYIDWDQVTRTCKMIRLKDRKTCDIVGCIPINDLQHLKEMIEFFKGKKETFDYSKFA